MIAPMRRARKRAREARSDALMTGFPQTDRLQRIYFKTTGLSSRFR